jgi:hypothetical protein
LAAIAAAPAQGECQYTRRCKETEPLIRRSMLFHNAPSLTDGSTENLSVHESSKYAYSVLNEMIGIKPILFIDIYQLE